MKDATDKLLDDLAELGLCTDDIDARRTISKAMLHIATSHDIITGLKATTDADVFRAVLDGTFRRATAALHDATTKH